MAAVLAKHTDGVADAAIANHVSAAIGHMRDANRNSFAPHKAWPDWEQRGRQYRATLAGFARKSGGYRDIARRQLHSYFHGQAMSLMRQLRTQVAGTTGENYDSVLFRIGYHLASAAQLRLIAEDGRAAGADREWLRKVRARADSHAQMAARYIAQTGSPAPRSDFPDLTSLGAPLRRSAQDDSPEETFGVWRQCRSELGGAGIAGGNAAAILEKAGKEVFANAERLVPQGCGRIRSGLQPKGENPCYYFEYSKPFRFGNVTDMNPGFHFRLYYRVEDFVRKFYAYHQPEPSRSNQWRVTGEGNVRACGGEGRYYFLRYSYPNCDPADITNLSGLMWAGGDWCLEILGHDKYRHPATIFGNQKNQLEYMKKVLEVLAARAMRLRVGRDQGPGNLVKVNAVPMPAGLEGD
jgi:hypothetical protein